MRHTHDTTFSEKILDFYKIFEESEQFFILFLKKMENLRQFLLYETFFFIQTRQISLRFDLFNAHAL
jgi:hypothetical protein